MKHKELWAKEVCDFIRDNNLRPKVDDEYIFLKGFDHAKNRIIMGASEKVKIDLQDIVSLGEEE